MSGKALAAGVLGFDGPAASALPLSYFSNDAKKKINDDQATLAGHPMYLNHYKGILR